MISSSSFSCQINLGKARKYCVLRLIVGVLLLSAWATPALAQDIIQLPCEVLEVSPNFQIDSSALKPIHYLLIHHANASDRVTLSKWLKTNSGSQVTFVINDKKYKGVLCRMAHCFGRGLLVFAAPIKVKPRDIVELILPFSPR